MPVRSESRKRAADGGLEVHNIVSLVAAAA